MNFLIQKIKETKDKKKIENLIVLIMILIITLIVMNKIWKDDDSKTISQTNLEKNENYEYEENNNLYENLEKRLEEILSTIKGVGEVKILINYSESSSIIPIFDETTTTSTTEEKDIEGGTRNVTQVQSQKDLSFSENSGNKEPITQKKVMPKMEGAIITAQGATNANVKTDIINAVHAITGLTIDKIQVFEKN